MVDGSMAPKCVTRSRSTKSSFTSHMPRSTLWIGGGTACDRSTRGFSNPNLAPVLARQSSEYGNYASIACLVWSVRWRVSTSHSRKIDVSHCWSNRAPSLVLSSSRETQLADLDEIVLILVIMYASKLAMFSEFAIKRFIISLWIILHFQLTCTESLELGWWHFYDLNSSRRLSESQYW